MYPRLRKKATALIQMFGLAIQPILWVVLYGVGTGAVAAMRVAADDPFVSAVIADSPFAKLDEEFRREARDRLPAGDFFAGAYKLGYNCWFRDSADKVDALAAARKLRDRPLMVVSPPAGRPRCQDARAVYEAAGEKAAILTVAVHAAGPRWMDDPGPIAGQLTQFLEAVARGDPDRQTDPLAALPLGPAPSPGGS